MAWRGLAEMDDPIRVPNNVRGYISKVRKAMKGSNDAWREADKAKALAVEQTGLSEAQVGIAIDSMKNKVVSYQPWMRDLKEAFCELDVQEENAEYLKSVLEPFLSPKEMEALSLRYGLSKQKDYLAEAVEDIFGSNGILTPIKKKGKWGEALSFKEVGVQMAISAEYGRRLCGKALEKLRCAAEDGRLDPAVVSFY